MFYQEKIEGKIPEGKVINLSVDDLVKTKSEIDRIEELNSIFARAGEEKKPLPKEVKFLKVILSFLKGRKRRPE
jgi:hypothetical protein